MNNTNENVIWQGKPNKKAFILDKIFGKGLAFPFVIIWILFDGGFIAALIATGAFKEFPSPIKVCIVLFFVLHLMPVWIFISKLFVIKPEWNNEEYEVTDRKILIKSGAINLTTKAIMYSEITDVTLHKGIFDRLMNTGDIYLNTSSGNYTLYDLDDSDRVYDQIQNTVIDISTDIEYPNALRPNENPGYNTKLNK